MSTEPIAALVGGGLLAASAARTAWTRHAIRRRLADALRDPDPQARVAAVQTAGENGVARNARLLLDVATDEQDIWVRQVLAQTIVRHRWEPATTRPMVELRIWAKRELLWSSLGSQTERPHQLDTGTQMPDAERLPVAATPASETAPGAATAMTTTAVPTTATAAKGWWRA